MAKLIQLQSIVKIYRMGDQELRALDGIDLDVEEGEFMSIMGASGSGKSTLMNVMGCLDRPTAGNYWLAGSEVSRLSASALADVRNRVIGFVFQGFNLLARTSAVENVALPLVYGGIAKRERLRRAHEALQQVGLGGRENHHPNQLSGGQQQRVAIARALVTRPKVILADEPTGNLDSRTSVEVMAVLQQLGRSGITVVLVTHEPDISAYTARVVVMRDGRIVTDNRQRPVAAVPVSGPRDAVTPTSPHAA